MKNDLLKMIKRFKNKKISKKYIKINQIYCKIKF